MGVLDTLVDVPDVLEVRDRVRLPDTHLSDEDLEQMWKAALGRVVKLCRVPVDDDGQVLDTGWPADLVEAAIRRLKRAIASLNLPLGYLDAASEYGPARIPLYDALIEEYEGPYRKFVFSRGRGRTHAGGSVGVPVRGCDS